jgi:hypothetical protein
MMKSAPSALLLLSLLANTSRGGDLPAVTHLGLRMRVRPSEQTFSCGARLTVRNTTGAPVAELPFVLYRLFTVDSVIGGDGAPLPYSAAVTSFEDEGTLQAMLVVARLPSPLPPGDSTLVVMKYGGHLLGYPEVMAYVHDRIDEEYSLFRPDAFAYPALAHPSFASVYGSSDHLFTYDVTVTVPTAYTVATGGALKDRTASDSTATFTFTSRIPTWRLDVAVAKFSVAGEKADGLSVYYLPGDEDGARNVLAGAKRAIAYYMNRFGRPPTFQGYTIIEIPDGWGSQAGDYYFLQTGAAFKDSSNLPEVYHEIGHTWNPRPAASVQRCRYFDEAFASYFQALAVREFDGEAAFLNTMERYRESFSRWAARDSMVASTPISLYGRYELGRHSYTKGAWSLYVLEQLLGAEAFTKVVVALRERSASEPVDFSSFRKTAEEVSGLDLKKYFDEWIDGAGSSRLLTEKTPIDEIVARLR